MVRQKSRNTTTIPDTVTVNRNVIESWLPQLDADLARLGNIRDQFQKSMGLPSTAARVNSNRSSTQNNRSAAQKRRQERERSARSRATGQKSSSAASKSGGKASSGGKQRTTVTGKAKAATAA